MNNSRTCPKCGSPLPTDAPEGLCPRCLLQDGLAAATTVATPPPDEIPTTSDPQPAASLPRPQMPALLGKVRYFGDYELLEEIARGGMGVVYKARQTSLNRTVAVKMILAGGFASEDEIKRFHTEAEAAANLQHPNIVAIHEVGEHEGLHYFSMDYVEGRNLAQIARAGALVPARAARIVKAVAEAIQYAHLRGVLHRDLKPQNVMMAEGDSPRVTDFGLAKRVERDSGQTRSGAVLGSPSYMSPEQAQGKQELVGPQSDIYSLGAILYELLTGQPPFRGETMMATLAKVVAEDPVAPRKFNATIPQDLQSICLKCLEKRPERRYHSARGLVEDLERFLEHKPVLARPASVLRRSWSWSQRHPWALTGVATVCLLVLLCAACGLWQRTRFLRWQVAYPGEMPPLRLNLLILTSSLGLLSFMIVGTWADRRFRRQFKRRRVEGHPIPGAHLLAYGLLGTAAIAYGVALLLKGVQLWAWEWPGRESLFGLVLFGGVLLWGGASLVWRAVGAHESASFGHLVERQFAPPTAEERLGSKGENLQRAGLWDGAQTIFGSAVLALGFGGFVAFLVKGIQHVLAIGSSGLGALFLGGLAGAIPLALLRRSSQQHGRGIARHLVGWAMMLAIVAGAYFWLGANSAEVVSQGAAAGFFGTLAVLILRSWDAKRLGGDPALAGPGAASRSGRWPAVGRLALLCLYLGLTYATALSCGARWSLVKYQGLFAAPGELPEWGTPFVRNPPAELNFATTPTLEALSYSPPADRQLWARFKSLENALGFRWTFPWAGELNDLEAVRNHWRTESKMTGESVLSAAQEIQTALRSVETELTEIRHASRRPLAQLEPAPPLSSPSGRELNLALWPVLGRLFSLHASSALALGQADAALDDSRVLLRLAALMNSRLGLEMCKLRIMLVGAALQFFWEGWVGQRWSAAQLAEFQTLFASLNLVRDFDNHLRFGEQVGFNALLEKQWSGVQSAPFFVFQEAHLFYNRLLLEHLMAGYSSQRQTVSPRQIREHQAACAREWSRSSLAASLGRLMLPNLHKTYPYVARGQTFAHLAVVACALERHRLERGAYPTKLEELTPTYLPRLPHDVINGLPLKYRRQDDGHFLLYSVGWNEVDDGGSWQVDSPGTEPRDWVWLRPASDRQ